ncbi:MAG: hypothetical protein ACE5HD_01165, partial [Acidobacteriota bacterium]
MAWGWGPPSNFNAQRDITAGLVDVPVDFDAGAGTIAVDATDRMWVAYDTAGAIQVVTSEAVDHDQTWSAPITLASGITLDDLDSVVAFDGKIGVAWSNQATQRFGFRYHLDPDPPAVWSSNEVSGAASNLNNASSLKESFVDELVVIAATGGSLTIKGVLFTP